MTLLQQIQQTRDAIFVNAMLGQSPAYRIKISRRQAIQIVRDLGPANLKLLPISGEQFASLLTYQEPTL